MIAPIFRNSISEKSTITHVLDKNDKSYYQSLSYGVFFQYQITSKLGIRTGISNQNFIQETNNVLYTVQIDEINSVFKNNFISFLPNNSNEIYTNRELISKKINEGTVKQEINFIEVPLEINYLLIDKKLQLNVLSGASILFLSNQNNLIRTTENKIINLGEASNINQTHFSINFGFGLSYPIFTKMRFNVQPTFRYQINTLNQNNNNPYYIGIYTGLSFKF